MRQPVCRSREEVSGEGEVSGDGLQGFQQGSAVSASNTTTTSVYKYKEETWEYKLYEKILEKQQATVATMVSFAQKIIPSNVTILRLVQKRIEHIQKQNLGEYRR